jgi:hypothetical protein
MALLWIDGFEGYGTSGTPSLTMRGYTVVNGSGYVAFGIATGRISGYSVYNSGSSNPATSTFETPALTTDPTFIVGCALSFSNTTTSSPTFSMYDNATLGINVTISTTGVSVQLGATTIATYSTTLYASTWYYIEMKVFCHSTSGSVEVRINDSAVISLIGVNTKTGSDSYYNRFLISTPAQLNVNYYFFDDLYICDGSGTSANDFLGSCHVIGIFPNADTSTEQWTPSTGTSHYALVNENPANSTNYVSTSTQAQEDLWTYSSLNGTGTIVGLQVTTTANLSSGTSIILESPIVSNGVVELGPDNTVTSASYLDFRHISTTDPNTGAAWTIAGLSAAQIGIKAM